MSKFRVCPACEGEGYVSKIGAFTGADLDDWYGDDTGERDEFVREYRRRGGAYDKACGCCGGQRVATREQIAAWEGEMEADAQYRAESAAYAMGL